jgi:N-methylhydantoinase A
VLVPRHPGVLSAAGLLAAPIEHEASPPLPRREEEFDLGEVRRSLHALDQRCSALMNDEKVEARSRSRCATSPTSATPARAITSKCRSIPALADSFGTLTAAFYAAHDRTYGYAPQAPIRLVNLRSVHTPPGLRSCRKTTGRPAAREALIRRTRILLPDQPAPVEAAVYDRAALKRGRYLRRAGHRRAGRHHDAGHTGWRGRVDPHGNLVLERTSN